MQHIAVLAVSGRMLAECCHALGYQVHLINCFNDVDAVRIANSKHKMSFTEEGFNSQEVLSAISNIKESVELSGVLIGSGIESNPKIIDEITELTNVYGNTSKVFHQVHNAKSFFSLLEELKINYPKTVFSRPKAGYWLRKRSGGLGGQHIVELNKFEIPDDENHYFQEYVKGVPMSALFFLDSNSCHLIGVHHLLMHERFNYAGAIRAVEHEISDVKSELLNIVRQLQTKINLQGLCGLDFILDNRNQVNVLELNARPTATMGLYQKKTAWIKAQIDCFSNKNINKPTEEEVQICGENIIYALKDCVWPADMEGFDFVHDIPPREQRIKSGEPVCTIKACATNSAETKKLLYDRALIIRERLDMF